MDGPDHNSVVRDQFTRQAALYAASATIRRTELVERIVRMAAPHAGDTVLDVACGPGLMTCAFARKAGQAVGIDLTSAMLDQARLLQVERGVENVSWVQGDATRLPFREGQFTIVHTRFSFHHLPEPLVVLREMCRAGRGGKIVVADSSPAAGKAESFNAMERLRDPSHVRALAVEELCELFAHAGLPHPSVIRCRMEGNLDELLARSFPVEGGEARIRRIFEESLGNDALDLHVRRVGDQIAYAFPVAILAAAIPKSFE